MSPFVTCGAGFLLAVLWMDLMFDVQLLRDHEDPLPERTLASIAAYYARVTTAARPMNRLIASVMLATTAAAVVEIAEARHPTWVAWASLILLLVPVALAGGRIVPAAVRLGTRSDPPQRQSAIARSICREHIICACSVALLIIVQLAFS